MKKKERRSIRINENKKNVNIRIGSLVDREIDERHQSHLHSLHKPLGDKDEEAEESREGRETDSLLLRFGISSAN